MSIKSDIPVARTAQDIERKYSFGKTFADMLGLINDNRDKVDSVESSLRDVNEKTTTLERDTESIRMEAKDLTSKVEMVIDTDDMSVVICGFDDIVTKTGYSFGADGLNISKSDEETENLIDHSGMYVKLGGRNVLVANNEGVEATDLHAKTYLKIGADTGRSRFEDYGDKRTACFWIGG